MSISTQTEIYPWQYSQWQSLISAYTAGKLHHALLLTGVKGLGKFEFAQIFANYLLCEQKSQRGMPCSHCRSCLLFKNQSHPDVYGIYPEEEGKTIKIEAIRALSLEAAEASTRAGAKVVIISPAENMNAHAANALLKILEEPFRDEYYFILVSSEPYQLPPTILSRLLKVHFYIKNKQDCLDFVSTQISASTKDILLAAEISAYAPLETLNCLKNNAMEHITSFFELLKSEKTFIEIAQQLSKNSEYAGLDDFYLLLYLAIREQYKTSAQVDDLYAQLIANTKVLFQKLSLEKIYFLFDLLNEWKQNLQKGMILNKQMLIETFLYHLFYD